MINNVSFGRLEDNLITQPQANSVAPAAPAAASGVQSDSFEKKGSGAKKAVGFFATVAAALTALALAVKFGKLKSVEDLGTDPKFLAKVKNEAAKFGEKINELAKKAIDSITGIFKKNSDKVDPKKIPVEGDPNFIGPLKPQPGDPNFIGPLPEGFVKP